LKNTEELLSNISDVKLQVKEIDPTEENIITLTKGSTIDIPANSLVFKDGSAPQGKITIQAKETFTYADFINEDLHSSSKGDILETGGMVYIDAKVDGKELFFKEGAAMEITYPEQEVKKGMQIFYGENGHDDEMDWVLDDNEVSLKNKELPTDLKEILEYELAPVEKPQISFSKMLHYPNLPRQPYDAREPKLPIKENLDLGLTKLQKSFMSKEKKERKRNALFDKKMKAYDKALLKYEEGHEKYLKKLAVYKVKKPQVEATRQLWKEEMDMRLDSIYSYKRKRRAYVENERMQDALRYVKKLYGKKSDQELFSTFYKICTGEVEVKKLSAEATHRIVFGKEFIRVVRMKGLDIRHIDKRLEKSNTEYLKMINHIDTKNFEKAFAKNGTMKAKNLNQYVASINQFGWINIDRFLKLERNMLAGVGIPNESITTKFYCIFKESRSILQASFKKNGFKFANLPKGQAYKIIGIKLENGKPKMAVRDFTLKEYMNISMDFKEVDLEEMKEEFTGLESFSM
jgi:glucan-binding YG repeat protein